MQSRSEAQPGRIAFQLDPKIQWNSESHKEAEGTLWRRFDSDEVENEYVRYVSFGSYGVFVWALFACGFTLVFFAVCFLAAGTPDDKGLRCKAALALGSFSLIAAAVDWSMSHRRSFATSAHTKHVEQRQWMQLVLMTLVVGGSSCVFAEVPTIGGGSSYWAVAGPGTLHAAGCFAATISIMLPRTLLPVLVIAEASCLVSLMAMGVAFPIIGLRLAAQLLQSVTFISSSYNRDVFARLHFCEIIKLAAAERMLIEQRNTIAHIVKCAIPWRVAKRISECATTEIPPTALLDRSENATVCVTAPIDFDELCTSRLLRDVFTTLHHIYTIFDAGTQAFGVDRGGTLGDSYYITAGLIRESKSDAGHAAYFALWLQRLREVRSIGFRSFLASGKASGAIVGGGRVIRYLLHGPALDTASSALRLLRQGQVGCNDESLRQLASLHAERFRAAPIPAARTVAEGGEKTMALGKLYTLQTTTALWQPQSQTSTDGLYESGSRSEARTPDRSSASSEGGHSPKLAPEVGHTTSPSSPSTNGSRDALSHPSRAGDDSPGPQGSPTTTTTSSLRTNNTHHVRARVNGHHVPPVHLSGLGQQRLSGRTSLQTSPGASVGSAFVVGAKPSTATASDGSIRQLDLHVSTTTTNTANGSFHPQVDSMVAFANFAIDALNLQTTEREEALRPREEWQIPQRYDTWRWKGVLVNPADEAAFREYSYNVQLRAMPDVIVKGGFLQIAMFIIQGFDYSMDIPGRPVSARWPTIFSAAFASLNLAVNWLAALVTLGILVLDWKTVSPVPFTVAAVAVFSIATIQTLITADSVITFNPFFMVFPLLMPMGIGVTRWMPWHKSFLVMLFTQIVPCGIASSIRMPITGTIVFAAAAFGAFAASRQGSQRFRERFCVAFDVRAQATAVRHATHLLNVLAESLVPAHAASHALRITDSELRRASAAGESSLPPAQLLEEVQAMVHLTEPVDSVPNCVVVRLRLQPVDDAEASFARWGQLGALLGQPQHAAVEQIEVFGDTLVLAGPFYDSGGDERRDPVFEACMCAHQFLVAIRLQLHLSFTATLTLDEAHGVLLGRGSLRYGMIGVAARHGEALLRAAPETPAGAAIAYLTKPFLDWLADGVNRAGSPPPWPISSGAMGAPQRWMVRGMGLVRVWPLALPILIPAPAAAPPPPPPAAAAAAAAPMSNGVEPTSAPSPPSSSLLPTFDEEEEAYDASSTSSASIISDSGGGGGRGGDLTDSRPPPMPNDTQ